MASTLPPDFITQVKQALLPFVATVDDRESLLTEAFYLVDPRPYQQIKLEGSPGNFCVPCVKTLLDIGCLTEQEHGLAILLNTVRHNCGVDKQKTFDQLIEQANLLCEPAQIEPQPLPIPAALPPLLPAQSVATPLEERSVSIYGSVRGESCRLVCPGADKPYPPQFQQLH